MRVELKFIHISSEHNITAIFSRIYTSFWNISHFRRNSISNWWAWQTQKVTEYKVSWTRVNGGGIHRISFLPGQPFSQTFLHPKRLTWTMFRAFSMPGHCISQLILFEKISAGHLETKPGLSLGWSHMPPKVPKNTNAACHSEVETVLSVLYSGVCSSSRECAGVSGSDSIVLYNEPCRIDIGSIDDWWRYLQMRHVTSWSLA